MNLYIIQAVNMEIVKIGISENVQERFRTLQSASPISLEIVFTWTMPRFWATAAEATIHKELDKYHSHGEWFKIDAVKCLDVVRKAVEKCKQDTIHKMLQL